MRSFLPQSRAPYALGWLILATTVGEASGQGTSTSSGGVKQVKNSIGIELVWIPPGEFQMGSALSPEEVVKRYPGSKADWSTCERPLHRVRITKPFYMGKHEITRGQFRKFVEATGYKTQAEYDHLGGKNYITEKSVIEVGNSWLNPGFPQTDDHPVVNVSWNDAVAFCEWLSKTEGKSYRLPTEAEFEYCQRAGSTAEFQTGDDPEALVEFGNIADARDTRLPPHSEWAIRADDTFRYTSPAGAFKPNAFGLCDMHGNALEWCSDWFSEKYYECSPLDDPHGPDSGTLRVMRGASWVGRPIFTRCAFRLRFVPYWRGNISGFRVAYTPYETLVDWPWEPKYFDVGQGRIHYIDVGEGPTVVLLHGCPAWSYMWRNVIPTLSKSVRVLAVDMLGMGRSDKPEVGYTYFDHLRYLTSFFKAKVPPGSVFIGHDWGSALGLSMMRRGVFEPSAFGASELFTVLPPEAYGKPDPAHNRWRTLTGNLVVSFCDPEMGPLLVGELDVFNRAVLPLLMERKLSDGERNAYCSVYPTPGSRRALWTWPTQVPLWDPTRHPQGIRGPKEVLDEFTESGKWLVASEQPKLFFTLPNGMTKSTTGDWLASNLQKATVTHLGPGRHYGPEDYPDDVARSITAWLGKTGVIASEKLEK